MGNIEQIKGYLQDEYERDFFDACIRNLADVDNPLRLSNFSYSLRELLREILSKRAPDERACKCKWYEPDKTSKNGITRTQRVKYAIQGGLPDAILDEKMRGLVLDTCKDVRKQVEKLSAFTHITRDVLYGRNDVEALSDQAFDITDELIRIYADGAVSVYPEGENGRGMTVNEGERMCMVIPFDSTLESKIPDSLDTLDLKICDFELKMGEAESYM